MFSYNVFTRLIAEKGITPYRVGQETGISPVVFTQWKNGKSKPKADKILKLAIFFKVPFEEFIDKGGFN